MCYLETVLRYYRTPLRVKTTKHVTEQLVVPAASPSTIPLNQDSSILTVPQPTALIEYLRMKSRIFTLFPNLGADMTMTLRRPFDQEILLSRRCWVVQLGLGRWLPRLHPLPPLLPPPLHGRIHHVGPLGPSCRGHS